MSMSELEKHYKNGITVGLEPARAYYIPFETDAEKRCERTKSQRFISLNGKWKIREFDSFEKADRFWEGSGENEIAVPSCVQFYGYDYFQYTNTSVVLIPTRSKISSPFDDKTISYR